MRRLIRGSAWSNQKLVLLHEGSKPVEVAIVEKYSDDYTYVLRDLKFCPWCGRKFDVEELMLNPKVEHVGDGDRHPGRQEGEGDPPG